jgi:ankyrin repeat protein
MPKIIKVDEFLIKSKEPMLASTPDHLKQHIEMFFSEGREFTAFSLLFSNIGLKAKKQLIDRLLQKGNNVNSLMYFLAVAVSEDLSECFQYVMDNHSSKVDLNCSYQQSKKDNPYSGHQNNLIKCLIYQENYFSLKVVLEAAIKKGIKPEELHKDKGGKTDLATLIINQSPPEIIDLYLQFSGLNQEPSKINFLEKQGPYSLLEYILYFGNSEVLEKFADEIKRQLEQHPEHCRQVDDFHSKNGDEILAIVNKILDDNGASYSLDPKHTIQPKEPLKKPSDRAIGFDYILRSNLQSFHNMLVFNPGYASIIPTLLDHIVVKLNRENPNGKFDVEKRQEIHEDLEVFRQTFQLFNPYEALSSVSLYPAKIRQMTKAEYIVSGLEKCRALLPKSPESIFADAVKFVRNSDLKGLQNLVMRNPWLTKYANKDGNTLLHFCTNGFVLTKNALGFKSDQSPKAKEFVSGVLLRRNEIFEFLALNGADMNAKNNGKNGKEGESALDIVEKISNPNYEKYDQNNQEFVQKLSESINKLVFLSFATQSVNFDTQSIKIVGDVVIHHIFEELPKQLLPMMFKAMSHWIVTSNIKTLEPLVDQHKSWLKDLRDENGNTLLHICATDFQTTCNESESTKSNLTQTVILQRVKVMNLLLEKGFNPNAENKDGKTLQHRLNEMQKDGDVDDKKMATDLLQGLSKYLPSTFPQATIVAKVFQKFGLKL